MTATAASLRQAILCSAEGAMAREPKDTDRRLHCFIAQLSGHLQSIGEPEADAAVWALFETKPPKS